MPCCLLLRFSDLSSRQGNPPRSGALPLPGSFQSGPLADARISNLQRTADQVPKSAELLSVWVRPEDMPRNEYC